MVVILLYCIKAKRCEHNALGYWSGLALCLTKVRSSRARCPATALIHFFLIFAPNIDCGYTLEPPHRDGSNEYPQSMFWSKNKKNRYTPAYPSFAI